MPEQNFVLEDESRLQLQSDKNTAHRFVAFLDIMGFKDRVGRTSHSRLLAQLTDFNKAITGYTIVSLIFSSILLFFILIVIL